MFAVFALLPIALAAGPHGTLNSPAGGSEYTSFSGFTSVPVSYTGIDNVDGGTTIGIDVSISGGQFSGTTKLAQNLKATNGTTIQAAFAPPYSGACGELQLIVDEHQLYNGNTIAFQIAAPSITINCVPIQKRSIGKRQAPSLGSLQTPSSGTTYKAGDTLTIAYTLGGEQSASFNQNAIDAILVSESLGNYTLALGLQDINGSSTVKNEFVLPSSGLCGDFTLAIQEYVYGNALRLSLPSTSVPVSIDCSSATSTPVSSVTLSSTSVPVVTITTGVTQSQSQTLTSATTSATTTGTGNSATAFGVSTCLLALMALALFL